MKAISLWQPWASAIAAGLKTVETRSWATNYRGPLAIHAAKRWTNAEHLFWDDLVYGGAPEILEAFAKLGVARFSDLPRGHVVATCEIYDCLSTDGPTPATHRPTSFDWSLGNYSAGRFAWLLKDIRPLEVPVKWTGRQGFFEWPSAELQSAC